MPTTVSDSDPILLIVNGPQRGVRFSLSPGVTSLGRTSHASIFIDDDKVSREHAHIDRSDGRVLLTDQQSTAGVFVDGKRVEQCELRPQSVLRLGETLLVFEPELELLLGAAEGVLLDPALQPDESTTFTPPADPLIDALAKAPGPEAIASALHELARRFEADRAFVLEFLPGEAPRVIATFGDELITVSRSVVRRAQAGEAVWSPNAAEDSGLGTRISLKAGKIRSLLALPLVAAGQVVGMLHLDRSEKNAWPESALAELVPVTRVCALGLLAGRAVKEARRANRLIEIPTVVAVDPKMKDTLHQAQKAAQSSATVLIQGPPGSGKETLARLIHATGPRKGGPFVVVQLAAVVQTLAESELFGHTAGAFTGAKKDRAGLFEAADGGTLFFDDIQDAPAGVQRKLLRALQERVVHRIGEHHPRPVDVRVIAASSRSLRDAVADGAFRDDLFYRLAVVTVDVPPLAQRPQDVVPLTEHFLKAACAVAGRPALELEPAVQERLLRHHFPGNVRELANLAERWSLVVDGPVIRLADLPFNVAGPEAVGRRGLARGDRLADIVANVEREMILRVRDRTGAVKAATAEILGISRVTLDKKIIDLAIDWKPSAKK